MSTSQDVSITQDVIRHWLRSKHCTLWQQWDIVSNDGLEGASRWMLEQISSIAVFAQEMADSE